MTDVLVGPAASNESEAALKESERRYRMLFSRATDGIFILSIDGRLIDVNESFARMHGYTVKEMLSMTLQDLDTPETAQKVPERMSRLLAGSPLTFEVEHYHRDGHVFPLEVSASLISIDGENYIQCFHRDITERRRGEESVARLSHRNELILTSSLEGILGLDLDGCHTFINPAAARMLGYEADELLGRTSHSLWHHTRSDGSPYPKEECQIYAAYRDGTTHRVTTEVFWRKDGTRFPVEYSSTPIYELGQLAGAVVVFADITDRKQAEEALIRSERLAAVGKMAAGVAHEFNNILSGISNTVQGLTFDRVLPDPETTLERLDTIDRQVRRAADVVKSMLALARPSPLLRQPISLEKLVHGVLILHTHQFMFESIRVKKSIPPELMVTVDSGKILQVLDNLVVNARHAMMAPGGGTLTFRAGEVAGEVRLSIADTGIGMSEEARGKLFTAFYTTKGGFAENALGQQGTGLGLAVSYRIMQEHGGRIEVESAPGKGACFTLCFPTDRS